MVTGGINILSNVSASNNNSEVIGNIKGNKSSSKMDFQSMFSNKADNSQNIETKKTGNLEKAEAKPDYNQDKSNMKVAKANEEAKTISEVKDEIEEIYEEVKNVIKDKLGINDEELEDILDELAMTLGDMLEPRNILQLMMEYSEISQPVEIVTDANLSETLKDINTSINTILDEYSQKLNVKPEDIKAFAKVYDEIALNKSEDESISFKEFVPAEEVKEVEVKNEAQDNGSSKNDTKESKDEKVNLESVITRLDDTVREVFDMSAVEEASPIDTEDVIRQINNGIRVNMNAESTSMELTLNPENLGKINIQVVSKNGVITANITTQDETIRRVVEASLITLKETLDNQGIKVDAVEVAVAGYSYAQGEGEERNNGETGRGRKNRIIDGDEAIEDTDDTSEDEVSTGTINYRA